MATNLSGFETWMINRITAVRGKEILKLQEALRFFLDNQDKIETLFSIYLKLQEIKMIFLDKFSNIKQTLRNFIITPDAIKPTNPEGFCIVNMKEQNVYKFVDRLNFSANNFNLIKNWNGDNNENI